VQVPAQALLGPAPLGDQVVAVIDKQLQFAQPLLAGARAVEVRFLQRRPSARERIDRIRLAARPAAPTLRAVSRGGTRTKRSPAASSSRSRARLTWRQSSSAQSRSPAGAQLSSARSSGPLQL
jgi:hypothetical protein